MFLLFSYLYNQISCTDKWQLYIELNPGYLLVKSAWTMFLIYDGCLFCSLKFITDTCCDKFL